MDENARKPTVLLHSNRSIIFCNNVNKSTLFLMLQVYFELSTIRKPTILDIFVMHIVMTVAGISKRH